MKSVFMFAAVLAVSAGVQGGIEIEASTPEGGLRVGETLEIRIVRKDTAALVEPTSGYLIAWEPGSIHGGRIVFPGGGEYLDEIDPFNDLEAYASGMFDYSYWQIDASTPEWSAPYFGTLIDQILFTCHQEGTAVIEFWDKHLTSPFDWLVFQVVPEPASLLLSGFGGLIAIRRNRLLCFNS